MIICESRVRTLALFQIYRLVDDLCDVFLKKGLVFTKIKSESTDANADLRDIKVCSAPLGYRA